MLFLLPRTVSSVPARASARRESLSPEDADTSQETISDTVSSQEYIPSTQEPEVCIFKTSQTPPKKKKKLALVHMFF